MNRNDYFSRLQAIVSPQLQTRHLMFVGAGAASESILRVVRHGVRRVTLIDPDIVEAHNLCRTAYGVADIGRPKVEALRDLILGSSPFTEVVVHQCNAEEVLDAAMLAGVDAVSAGTDSFSCQSFLNRLTLQTGTPAVYVDIHEGAKGGMILATLPGESGCYRCAATARYATVDAQHLDLPGAHGAMVDIAIVDAVACKLLLSLVERDEDSLTGRFWRGLFGRTLAVVRTSLEHDYGSALWRAALSDLPTSPKPFAAELEQEVLYAADTMWLRIAPDPACPDCHGGHCHE